MASWSELDDAVRASARRLSDRHGVPRLGVVLGSGFAPLAGTLGAGPAVPFADLPGFPESRVVGHGDGIAGASVGGIGVWVVHGRFHLYEGRSPAEVALTVRVLAEAGAKGVILTCAAGGLRSDDRPGDVVIVDDHLNLTGADSIAAVPMHLRRPAFPDLQGIYDERARAEIHAAAERAGRRVRGGVLAAVHGPCYETPAEVRMLRALGADLVSMSTVPEAVAARYLGLEVAALACVANRGAGMDATPLRHDDVVATVAAAVAENALWIANAIGRIATPA